MQSLTSVTASTDKGLPPEIQAFFNHLHDPHHPLFWVQMVPTVLLVAYILRRYVAALIHKPKFTKQDVVYQEYFASGGSLRNVLTKMGGANGCLRLVVTHDILWVTSWFPFSLFAVVYDLEHIVPLQSIRSIEGKTTMGIQSLQLTYVDGGGKSHALRIKPKNTQAFLDALEKSSDRAGAKMPPVNVVLDEPALTLTESIKKYRLNLLAVGLFPTVFFVNCGNFHVPFFALVPVFFATMFYGMWPGIAKKAPYTYQFVMGAVWMSGGLLGGLVASFLAWILGKHHL